MMKLWYNLRCFFGYHKYLFLKDLSDRVAMLKCEHCVEKFVLHKELEKIMPYNQEVSDFYEFGLKAYLKKYNNNKKELYNDESTN
jgi:hypothetical protein